MYFGKGRSSLSLSVRQREKKCCVFWFFKAFAPKMDCSPTSKALTDKGKGINHVTVVGSYHSEFTLKKGSGSLSLSGQNPTVTCTL